MHKVHNIIQLLRDSLTTAKGAIVCEIKKNIK